MRAAVIVFPGSNCDRDVAVCLKAAGAQVDMVWHGDTHLPACDLIVLPGVLGICNGFQVLTECGLLPGILMRNRELNFVCRNTRLNVSRTDTPFTHLYAEAEEISIPVAHNEGNYFADDETLKRLQGENRIVFTYAEGDNPNGACLDIAGITDATGRVLGMMPHPERRAETPLGGEDGRRIFDGAMEMLA